MHRCLEIQDIVLEVIERLAPPASERLYHPQKFSRELGALAAMSRTCRAFYEPCMDALWKVQNSLAGIVRCLPPAIPAGGCHKSAMTRFYTNAARIAYLRLPHSLWHSEYAPLLSRHVSLIQSHIGRWRDIFPKLQVLAIATICGDGVNFIWDTLFGPRLRGLILLSGLDIKSMGTVLSYASRRCSNLKSLESYRWSSSFNDSLDELEKVESFTYNRSGRLHESTVGCLAKLPHLRTINILAPYIASYMPTRQRYNNQFESLEHLTIPEIQDSDLQSMAVSSLLEQLTPGRLLHLYLHFDVDGRDISTFNHIFGVIGKNLCSLRTLSLLGWGPEATDQHETQEYDIDPLLRLQNLRTLSIRLVGMSSCFTDESIAKCGDAWPHLTELVFFQTPYYRMQAAGLTLGSLALFAQHFPRLVRLALELDATLPPRTTDPMTPNLNYLALDLSRSLIGGDCGEVAAHIARIYPKCSMRRVLAPMRFRKTTLHDDETKRWQEVVEQVEMFSKMGEDERRAAMREVWE
ncbi:hypothetical protein PHLGIDRAFT_157377 [Phlebiopsis gigantea 11061_1 CR5-6]|uniref:F-box domain-containing protein n=1 Tax=Phlebiopsis gigantea (strain 11061_1 CR5-6) TaxID=745531 RepID=A0A0C3PU34_PHLG1|nr:hypothetical protein PHLGIDRAFT_157377 [Phlebiopsis gigantea 11061_1 CR5-6]